MLQQHCKQVLLVFVALCTLASGCGKNRKTLEQGAAQGAAEEPLVVGDLQLDPLTPDNHVPPTNYLVETYDLEDLATVPPP